MSVNTHNRLRIFLTNKIFLLQVMYRYSNVQVRLCTGTVMYRYSYVQVRLCTGTVMYRYSYVQVRLYTGTVMYRYGYVQVRTYDFLCKMSNNNTFLTV